MKNKNVSMDYLEFINCVSAMTRCDEILTSLQPEWSKKARLPKRLLFVIQVQEIGMPAF